MTSLNYWATPYEFTAATSYLLSLEEVSLFIKKQDVILPLTIRNRD